MFIVKIVETFPYSFIDIYVPSKIYPHFLTRLSYILFYKEIGDGNVFVECSNINN